MIDEAEGAPANEAGLSRSTTGRRLLLRLRHSGRSTGVLAPLVLLWVAMTFASPYFLTQENILNILLQASIVGILAFGSTVVLITEEIDLSIGAVEGLAAVVAGVLMVDYGQSWPVAIAAAIAVGVLVGAVNGFVTTVVGVPSFIVTLAMLGIASGIALRLTDGQSVYGFPHAYQEIGQGKILGIPVPVIVAFVILIAMHLMLRHTRVGLNFFAVGGNRRAAALAGIRPGGVKSLALVISGAAAGVAGVLVSARLNAANGTFGSNDLLDAIAAVVIGGTALTGGVGSVVGTCFGVLLITTIRNGLTLLNVSPFWQTAAVGLMILTAAIIDRLARGRKAS
jgi:ribose transport system permease protein